MAEVEVYVGICACVSEVLGWFADCSQPVFLSSFVKRNEQLCPFRNYNILCMSQTACYCSNKGDIVWNLRSNILLHSILF